MVGLCHGDPVQYGMHAPLCWIYIVSSHCHLSGEFYSSQSCSGKIARRHISLLSRDPSLDHAIGQPAHVPKHETLLYQPGAELQCKIWKHSSNYFPSNPPNGQINNQKKKKKKNCWA